MQTRKFNILFLFSFLLIIILLSFVQATSGCCSYHKGVCCECGAQSDGRVICNDDWRGSSCYYSEMKMCENKTSTSEEATVVSVEQIDCYKHEDCKPFYNTCTCDYECISKDKSYFVACPKYCGEKPTAPKCECINNKCEAVYEAIVEERCYSDKNCQEKENWACAVPSGYSVEEKCNISTGECYCDVRKNEIEVDYNEEFTLKEGQTVIIPKRYIITLEDIYGVCKLGDYCYYTTKLWYFTHDPAHTFYLKEGESKRFGDNVIPAPEEKPVLKLLKIENNEAIFIVYPVYEVTVNATEINANTTITGKVITEEKECEGCISDNKCLPIGYRTSDKYCDADKSLKNQKQEDKNCNNNFECETNICVDGKCISSGLIQRILNFFKKLFGL